MYKNVQLIIFSVLFSFQVLSQTVRVKGHFTYTAGFEQVRFVGFKDSLHVLAQNTLKEGAFDFDLQNVEPGIYRLQYGHNIFDYVDVLLNGKEVTITIQMDMREGFRKPQFEGSIINTNLYGFLNKYNETLEQLRFHYHTFHAAPNKNQKEALTSKNQFLRLQSKLYKERLNFIKNNEQNLAGLYIQSYSLLIPSIDTLPKDVSTSYYNSYWKNLSVDNSKLQNTPFYHSYLVDYLGYYANQRLEPTPWEAQMKQVVDTVMQYMSKTTYTKMLALHYLLDGFKAIGHEGLLQYVDEYYAQTAQCLDDKLQDDVAYRLKSYGMGEVGEEIPNVFITDTLDLHSSIKGKTLLVFWSSSCPHCMEEWQKMEKWASKNQEYQIIAVSLDTNKKDYKDALTKLPKYVQYYCDFKGWDSEAIKKYYIMATPTLFEVDADKKFVKKGRVLEEF